MLDWFLSPLGIAVLTLTSATAILSLLRYGWRAPVTIVLVGVGLLALSYKVIAIPLPASVGLPVASIVYDVHGRPIGHYSEVRRYIIDTRRLPDYLRQAVVTAEDRDYFEHGGLSIRGLLRATWRNLRSGRLVEGGSTINQQYVKVAVLHDSSRTIVRKIKEAVLAVKLGKNYTKEQILDFYLNTIYLGRGAYGIEAASRAYFDKHASELSLSEAAFLAGIIRAPEAYQPDEQPDRARARRDAVLDAMAEEGYITRSTAASAARMGLSTADRVDRRVRRQKAAYFMEWLRRSHLAEFDDCLYTCGLKIHTTLDLGMQRAAEEAIKRHLPDDSDPQAALVAMTPAGEVRAMIGGRETRSVVAASGFNYATDYPGRHAGSALKPFTLLAALREGISSAEGFSGASPRTIASRRCASRKKSWKVSNFGGSSFGFMSVDQATAHSVNTIYAQLIEEIGPRRVAELLSEMGFARTGTRHERDIRAYCSLALGALDVTPLEIARAYATFPAKGLLPPVSPITHVEAADGHCLKSLSEMIEGCDEADVPKRTRIVNRDTATRLNLILQGVVDGGTGGAARLDRPAAGKTGTSQNYVDAWFAGYVPQLTAAVWLGHPSEKGGGLVPQMRDCRRRRLCRPVHGIDVSGGTLPARIWADFMRVATERMRVAYFEPQVEIAGSGDMAPATIVEEDPPARRKRDRPEPESVPESVPEPEPSRGDEGPLPIPIPTPP